MQKGTAGTCLCMLISQSVSVYRRASEFSDEHFKDGFLRALEQGLLPPNVHM